MRKGLTDLPQRWRSLLTLPDDQLAGDTVERPTRAPRESRQVSNVKEVQLPDKLILLQHELAGQPQVCLAHAALIVLIRREQALTYALQSYFRLWDNHEALLLDKLSFRWLVSAADTLVDHGRSPEERATAFAAVLFANTIKLYETERYFSLNIDPNAAGLDGPPPQFDLDGIKYFNVAKGDTVGNMFQRKARLVGDLGLSGKILDQVMTRANRLDTVYARFRARHIGRYSW